MIAREHALLSAIPFVEWRHGYAFFPQLQRFQAAETRIA
jgi:hypothetical protein